MLYDTSEKPRYPGFMTWLNYHHLRYFWAVAREGSVARASEKLRLAPPTITGQIRLLEEAVGERLFERAGRGLALTPKGRLALDYAEQIFSIGEELVGALNGRDGAARVPLRIGIADVLPKAIVSSSLRAVLEGGLPVRLICCEDRSVEEFLEDMAAHRLDLVLADAPAMPGRPGVFNHRLAEYGTTVFGRASLARGLRTRFPRSLHGARFVVAGNRSARRLSFEQWCKEHGIEPVIVAEADDASLIMELGSRGDGLFIGPSFLEREIRDRYGVAVIGRLPGLRQEFYAISIEWRGQHPAVRAACEAICGQIVPLDAGSPGGQGRKRSPGKRRHP